MVYRIKALGLAIAVFVAISSVGASMTFAASLHSEGASTVINGAQSTIHGLTTDFGTLTCNTATFTGSQSGTTSETLTITPTYKECTYASIFGPIAVTMNFNECDYKFNANGTMHIECPAGKNIVMSGPGCTHTIPAQTLSSAISYSSTGSGSNRDIDLTLNISGLTYSYSGFTCGSGSGTANGTYSGSTTLKGNSEGEAVGIWWTP